MSGRTMSPVSRRDLDSLKRAIERIERQVSPRSRKKLRQQMGDPNDATYWAACPVGMKLCPDELKDGDSPVPCPDPSTLNRLAWNRTANDLCYYSRDVDAQMAKYRRQVGMGSGSINDLISNMCRRLAAVRKEDPELALDVVKAAEESLQQGQLRRLGEDDDE